MTDAKYEVVSQTVEVLLSPGTTVFEVPAFQRKYAWGSDEIFQLIDDIFGETAKSDLPYFLGSIVLASKEGGSSSDPLLVLDGQQRLTTLSLIIAVLINKLKENNVENADEHRMYLFSRRLKGSKRPKILLQEDDLKIYEALINNPTDWHNSKYKNNNVGSAVGKIIATMDEYKNIYSNKGEDSEAYENMLERLLYDVEIVRIKAPSEKDAFRLFETLNDRGLALSAADLIKNKLFFHCGTEIDDAFDAWSNMISLTKDDDVVNYLRYYWIATQEFARKRGLYDTYKNYINKLDSTSATLLALELEEVAKDYEQIINPNPNTCAWGIEVGEALERLNSYRARACRPAILACNRFCNNNIRKIVDICESISVRYSLVGEKNPNQLERIYSEIAKILRQSGEPLKEIAQSEFLKEIPSDEEFQMKLVNKEITSVTSGWREILVSINRYLSSGETKIERPSLVHVEHILPQNPKATVLTESNLSQEEALTLCNKFGNLTLLSGKKNREISNSPFSKKKDVLSRSEIKLTNELGTLEKWSKEQIEERTDKMAEIAVKVFKHPVAIAS